MKRFLTTGAIVLLTVGAAAAQTPATPAGAKMAGGGVSQALMDLENQWVTASKAKDTDALAAILADGFVGLDSDGAMPTKAEYLARTKKANWTAMEIGDMKVTVHGDSAIVSGSWTGTGTDGTGKAINNAKERWVDTWVKTPGGKWQCVASAAAPVK